MNAPTQPACRNLNPPLRMGTSAAGLPPLVVQSSSPETAKPQTWRFLFVNCPRFCRAALGFPHGLRTYVKCNELLKKVRG